MAGYNLLPSGGSALGSLLRKMQEDRLSNPAQIPVNAADSSPIRAQVQGPLQAPESVGSDKIVSIKAPLAPGQELPTMGGTAATTSPSVPVGTPDGVIPPVAPVAPSAGIPGISAPPSFSNTGVQLPNSSAPAPTNTGSIAGSSTSQPKQTTTTQTAKPGLLPTSGYNPSSPQPSPAPKATTQTSSNKGLAAELIPSAMKAVQSVGRSLTNFRGAISGSPLFLLPSKLDMLFGPGASKNGKKS